MLSALSYLSNLKSKGTLTASPILIGPQADVVDLFLRQLEKHLSRPIEQLPSKDSQTFFHDLKIKYSQQNLFKAPPFSFLTNCTPKFLEKTIDYKKILTGNVIFHAPKLPFKSPLISQLEKTQQFIVLTCFNPTQQELLNFAADYLNLNSSELKTIFSQLPQQLPKLIDELDKIKLLGLESYQPELHPQEEAIDTICFHLMSHSTKALRDMNRFFALEDAEPTFFLKSLLFQLQKLKLFLITPRHARGSLRLNKLMTTRFESLSTHWTINQLNTIQAKLYATEYKMRLHHEMAPLMLERDLSALFILSQTKI